MIKKIKCVLIVRKREASFRVCRLHRSQCRTLPASVLLPGRPRDPARSRSQRQDTAWTGLSTVAGGCRGGHRWRLTDTLLGQRLVCYLFDQTKNFLGFCSRNSANLFNLCDTNITSLWLNHKEKRLYFDKNWKVSLSS